MSRRRSRRVRACGRCSGHGRRREYRRWRVGRHSGLRGCGRRLRRRRIGRRGSRRSGAGDFCGPALRCLGRRRGGSGGGLGGFVGRGSEDAQRKRDDDHHDERPDAGQRPVQPSPSPGIARRRRSGWSVGLRRSWCRGLRNWVDVGRFGSLNLEIDSHADLGLHVVPPPSRRREGVPLPVIAQDEAPRLSHVEYHALHSSVSPKVVCTGCFQGILNNCGILPQARSVLTAPISPIILSNLTRVDTIFVQIRWRMCGSCGQSDLNA